MRYPLIALGLIAATAQAQDACVVYRAHIGSILSRIPERTFSYDTVMPAGYELDLADKVRMTLDALSRSSPNDPAACTALDKQLTALDVPGKLHLPTPPHVPTREEQSAADMRELEKEIKGEK